MNVGGESYDNEITNSFSHLIIKFKQICNFFNLGNYISIKSLSLNKPNVA